jgi:methylated-DNA-protein-cysteine methyltransferase-like protein
MKEDFFSRVHLIVSDIPSGKVVTYGQIAAFLGQPRAARTVGWALHSTPAGVDLPWHRVINSQGRISGHPASPRAREQRALLEDEGIVFDESGRIDLEEYGWKISL